MSELKKCPFCGREAELIKLFSDPGNSWHKIRCSSTRLFHEAQVESFSKEKTIETWNTRARGE